MTEYKPPFPWFGGKSRVAEQVWQALGDVSNYVEPFFGSGAVLFGRPSNHTGYVETVNDLDHYLANFWRAVQHDPEQVAHYADNPVNEDDLTARHIWLVKHGRPLLDAHIPADPDYYDAKIAGWWVWGICSWIGSGWCSGSGPWTEQDGVLVNTRGGVGVWRQRPHLSDNGQGVNRKLPHLSNSGRGVNRKLPRLSNSGVGVNRPESDLVPYFQQLADRLKNVRVCSGDWSRVVTNGALSHGKIIGVFLDPPYSMDIREDIYNTDAPDIAKDVLAWCVANGNNPRYRIALCGYDGEHNALEGLGWSKMAWKAGAAYSTATSDNQNRHMERIWFSPACIRAGGMELDPQYFELAEQRIRDAQQQPGLLGAL